VTVLAPFRMAFSISLMDFTLPGYCKQPATWSMLVLGKGPDLWLL